MSGHRWRGREWNPLILNAAEAMYERLRIVNPEKYKKWSKLDIDAIDHYCIAARQCIEAFHFNGTRDVYEEADYTPEGDA